VRRRREIKKTIVRGGGGRKEREKSFLVNENDEELCSTRFAPLRVILESQFARERKEEEKSLALT
jgi:hypothetical protein